MNCLRDKARLLLSRAVSCTQRSSCLSQGWARHSHTLPALRFHTCPVAGDTAQSVDRFQGSNLRVPVFNWRREVVGEHTLPGDIFNVPIRKDILHRVVRWQLAKRQQGTHKTKTRSEVRGGGRKPHSQKGSGRARFGSIRAAQRRGGGIIFGPVVRSHEHGLQKKVRKLGLKCALTAKATEGRLTVVDSLAVDPPKTKVLDEQLHALLPDVPRRSILIIDSSKDTSDGGDNLRKAASNLPWTDVLPQGGANVYSILQRDNLILSRSAVDLLVERLRQTRPLKAETSS
ncbi:g414 [Coccomyxa elongata]